MMIPASALNAYGSCEVRLTLLVLQGRGILTADGTEYPFSAGELFHLQRDTPFRITEQESCIFGQIRYNSDTFTAKGEQRVISGRSGVLQRLFYLAMELQMMELQNPDRIMSLTNTLFIAVQDELFRQENRQKVHPTVQQVFESITQHFREPDFDLTAVIAATNYNPDYLRQLFRAQTGLAPKDFLIAWRLDWARNLFENEGKSTSVAQVAHACGFSSPSYFARQFRQHYGVSPSAYQAQTHSSDSC